MENLKAIDGNSTLPLFLIRCSDLCVCHAHCPKMLGPDNDPHCWTPKGVLLSSDPSYHQSDNYIQEQLLFFSAVKLVVTYLML